MLASLLGILFPKRLKRLSYFVRFLGLFLGVYFIIFLSQNIVTMSAICSGFLAYILVFCIIPRARDCGLPVWIALLIFVPVISIFPMFVLFFKRTRLPKEEQPMPSEIDQVPV